MRVGVALQEVLNLFESDRPAAAIEVAVVNKEALETALCPTPPRGLRPRVRLLIKGITALEPEVVPGLVEVEVAVPRLTPALR